MSIEKAWAHLEALGLGNRIVEIERACNPFEWADVSKLPEWRAGHHMWFDAFTGQIG